MRNVDVARPREALARTIMDNAKFWDDRYRSFPQLGSGPGSRGYAAAYKNRLVKAAIKLYGICSIVDIGCGDLCWLDPDIVESCSYVGLDISAVAVERARAAYPSLAFAAYDVTVQRVDSEADLVICFDVLIHQTDLQMFCVALNNILSAIRKIGLISYLTPPMPDGTFPPAATLDATSTCAPELEREFAFCRMMAQAMPGSLERAETAFHKPLPIAVAGLGYDLDLSTVGRYRHQTVYSIQVHPNANTPR
jgi:SAM-dependent methyltransferase